MATTLIRKAAWAIVWDPGAKRHAFLRDADIAFEGTTLRFVGRGHPGHADRVIDGGGLMVMPGLINVHSHPEHEPAYRGIREEHGLPSMYMSGLFERMQAFGATDDAFRVANAEFAYCELLRSGVTTLVDISPIWDGWIDVFARSGLRGVLAPGFASARWKLVSPSELGYAWDEEAGRRGFARALELIDRAQRHPSGRLSGMVSPMQIDTCSAELLRDSHAAARERKLPFTVHLSQGVNEVLEIIRRHAKTPAQWAEEIGILGPETILGHAIFLDTHSWVRWHTRRDMAILGAHGCSVAHCPTPFERYGQILESFGDYRAAGVNMAIGTDTTPHNMIEEMRKAVVLARVAARHIDAVTTADILQAATIGGARALGREDIGRLAPGAKADLVLVDLRCPEMMPARDPLRSLVYHAADRAVRDVYVDGVRVVADGKVLTIDQADAAGRLAEAQARMIAAVPTRDYKRRTADEITPLSLAMMSGGR